MRKCTVMALIGDKSQKNEFNKVQESLASQGNIVIGEEFADLCVGSEEKEQYRKDLRRQKIDMADEIYVINKGGKVGEDAVEEIKYARCKGKKITFMEEPDEQSREYTLMFTWDSFHELPFALRQAVRAFRKQGLDYAENSDIWESIPDGIDPQTFKKAVRMYDCLLRRYSKI